MRLNTHIAGVTESMAHHVYIVIRRETEQIVYVGATNNLKQRWAAHLGEARRGKGYALHSAIRKHGASAFKIESIWTGPVLPMETRAKLSAALKGRPQSPEHRAKRAAAQIGRRHSPETIAKMSATHRGKKQQKQIVLGMNHGT